MAFSLLTKSLFKKIFAKRYPNVIEATLVEPGTDFDNTDISAIYKLFVPKTL